MENYKSHHILSILLIVVLTLTVYSFSLGAPFNMMDDQVSIVHNEQIRSVNNVGDIFKGSFFDEGAYYRPFVMLSFMVDYHFWGLNAFYYRVHNLILHILTAFMIYVMLRKLIINMSASSNGHSLWPRKCVWLASFAALAFAIHPVHWETVTTIAGRAILLAALFYVTSFYFFIRALTTGEDNPRRGWLVSMAWLCFSLALLSKESAITLPLIVLWFLFLMRRRKGDIASSGIAKGYLWLAVAGTSVIVGSYLSLRHTLGINQITYWSTIKELVLGVATFLKGVVIYLRLFVLPVDLQFDRMLPYIKTFNDPLLYGSIILLSLIGVCVFNQRQRLGKLCLFFGGWFILTIIPMAQLIPLRAQRDYASVAEHLLYLPSIGGIIFLCCVAGRKLMEWKTDGVISLKVMMFTITGLYLFLGLTTLRQSIIVSQDFMVLTESLQYNPDNLRVRGALALELVGQGQYGPAQQQYREILKREPGNIGARISLGRSLYQQGAFLAALREYQKLEGLDVGLYKQQLEINRQLAVQKIQQDTK